MLRHFRPGLSLLGLPWHCHCNLPKHTLNSFLIINYFSRGTCAIFLKEKKKIPFSFFIFPPPQKMSQKSFSCIFIKYSKAASSFFFPTCLCRKCCRVCQSSVSPSTSKGTVSRRHSDFSHRSAHFKTIPRAFFFFFNKMKCTFSSLLPTKKTGGLKLNHTWEEEAF